MPFVSPLAWIPHPPLSAQTVQNWPNCFLLGLSSLASKQPHRTLQWHRVICGENWVWGATLEQDLINQIWGNVTDKLLGPILDKRMWHSPILLTNADKQNPEVSEFQSCSDLFSQDEASSTLHSNLAPAQTSNLLTPTALLKLVFSLRSHYFPQRPVNHHPFHKVHPIWICLPSKILTGSSSPQ